MHEQLGLMWPLALVLDVSGKTPEQTLEWRGSPHTQSSGTAGWVPGAALFCGTMCDATSVPGAALFRGTMCDAKCIPGAAFSWWNNLR
jgi:hypothetical protein